MEHVPPRKPSRPSRSFHRPSGSINSKTEITINVYDLLPTGTLSSLLWACGTSLLHSGVVINRKEYAYGGHDSPGVTGVYWTTPRSEPPGGRFKCEILHGFTYMPQRDIDAIIREASEEFCGTAYNLLTRNCNHFTSHLCRRLTDRPGPDWLNRAASIGVALPCIVPKNWIEPPDYDLADGEPLNTVVGDGDDDDAYSGGEREGVTERSGMLRSLLDYPRLIGVSDDLAGPSCSSQGEPARLNHHQGKGRAAIVKPSSIQSSVCPPAHEAPG